MQEDNDITRKWEVWDNHLKETRPGWPCYIWPALYFEYKPETVDEYGEYDGLTFGIGAKFLSHNIYVTFFRRVTKNDDE